MTCVLIVLVMSSSGTPALRSFFYLTYPPSPSPSRHHHSSHSNILTPPHNDPNPTSQPNSSPHTLLPQSPILAVPMSQYDFNAARTTTLHHLQEQVCTINRLQSKPTRFPTVFTMHAPNLASPSSTLKHPFAPSRRNPSA